MIRTLLHRKAVVGVASLVVAGGIAAAIVVPAHAASSTPSPSASPQHRSSGHGNRSLRFAGFVLGRQLALETMKETGISKSTLIADLRAGQTLNQIAGSKAQSVVNAVIARAQSRLDAAVKAGKLTAAEEQTRLTRLRAAANELMGLHLAPFLSPHGHSHPQHGPSARPSPSAGTTATSL